MDNPVSGPSDLHLLEHLRTAHKQLRAELGKIISERLDAIRTVTTKTRETVARFKATKLS